MTRRTTLMISLSLILTATGLGLAQEESQQGSQPPPTLETRLYKIDHQDVTHIRMLLDGFVGRYDPSFSEHFNTLTLSAPEDVHSAVRALIEQYDKPPRSIHLQFYLLKGMRGGMATPQPLPDHIRSIVGEIASLTEFKSFELIASPQVRTQEGHGVRIQGGQSLPYEINIGNLRLHSQERLQVQEFHVWLNTGGGPRSAISLRTSFEIGDGETVVLGTSDLEGGSGEALVTLVTARLID
ncbi:MAG: hypothetical protein V3T83_19335 [Acidobacteriota bacterium]